MRRVPPQVQGAKVSRHGGAYPRGPREVSVLIVDASVAAKWFVEEEHGEAALSVLDEKNQLHAPDFLLLEMDSIVCKWVRRGVVSPAEGTEGRDEIGRAHA